jgi:TonB-dependent SusC/RagA subfamily outer membrane receptor
MNIRALVTTVVFTAITSSVSAHVFVDTTKPNAKPLIVINGKEHPGMSVSDLDSSIKPNQISSIDVLKDSAAVSLYGEQARDGVILIVTKDNPNPGVKNSNDPDDDIIFEKTEVEPAFPGGADAWKQFLTKNMNAAVPVKKHAPAGAYTVWVQFIVDKEGNISGIRALTNHGFGMEQECTRLIKLSPQWIPAMQNGHKVKAYRKQPITFVVD